MNDFSPEQGGFFSWGNTLVSVSGTAQQLVEDEKKKSEERKSWSPKERSALINFHRKKKEENPEIFYLKEGQKDSAEDLQPKKFLLPTWTNLLISLFQMSDVTVGFSPDIVKFPFTTNWIENLALLCVGKTLFHSLLCPNHGRETVPRPSRNWERRKVYFRRHNWNGKLANTWVCPFSLRQVSSFCTAQRLTTAADDCGIANHRNESQWQHCCKIYLKMWNCIVKLSWTLLPCR